VRCGLSCRQTGSFGSGQWAKCAPTVRHRRGPAYCGLDWGSTGALDATAMLAQQPRRPLTPVHSAAEPPEVRKAIAPVISPSGAYPISRFARRFGALP
jgi:hypothetical protein